MNEYMQPFGSGELSAGRVRSMRFPSAGEGYDPAAVHEFLEQVASAIEVLTSSDVASGMRRELERSSEISSRVVLAGQEAAERLREQAAHDARTILEDTRQLAEKLRDAAREEVERTREHVDDIRRTFMDELRDLYDRIGATLYRFEHSRASEAAELAAAATWPEVSVGDPPQPAQVVPQQVDVAFEAEPVAPQAPMMPDVDAAAGGLAPAWTQLDPTAYAPPAEVTPVGDAGMAVAPPADASVEPVVSEPEPLVDLTSFHEPEVPAAPVHTDAVAGGEMSGWLEEPAAASTNEVSHTAAGSAGDGGLVLPDAPEIDSENARAEALLANVDDVLAAAVPPEPSPLPAPPMLQHESQPDPVALQQFVLQSLHEGMDRTVVETWLAERYGIANAHEVVDAALMSQSQGGAGV